MFERFTSQARDVVVRAQQEARDLRHRQVGTEHLLLALLSTETGAAGAVLSPRPCGRSGSTSTPCWPGSRSASGPTH